MSKKALGINLDGCRIDCIRTEDKRNPFRVYRIGGGHRIMIAKYGDFMSVLHFLKDFYLEGMDTATLSDVREWAKDCGSIF